MKKMMFNDRYGLTQAVLDGQKTMTRRLVGARMTEYDIKSYLKGYTELANEGAQYKIGDIVAVAQSYKNAGLSEDTIIYHADKTHDGYRMCKAVNEKGFSNKMFVSASLMPHQIKITDIKVERLQDISDEDCIKEGIRHFDDIGNGYMFDEPQRYPYRRFCSNTPVGAFSMLIGKVSGKGTWERNPWVIAYSFELVK